MSNDILLFRSYILIVLFFLVPISLIVTLQIYFVLKSYILIYFLSNSFVRDQKVILHHESYNELFRLLLYNHRFSCCISSVELLIHIINSDMDIFYALLAYCYQKSYFFYIAEYYYLKALNLSPDNEAILSNLSIIYLTLDDNDKLKSINNKLKMINSVDSIT